MAAAAVAGAASGRRAGGAGRAGGGMPGGGRVLLPELLFRRFRPRPGLREKAGSLSRGSRASARSGGGDFLDRRGGVFARIFGRASRPGGGADRAPALPVGQLSGERRAA